MVVCQLWPPNLNPILPWIDGSYTTPRDTAGETVHFFTEDLTFLLDNSDQDRT